MHEFKTQDDLVAVLKDLYATALLDPRSARYSRARLVVLYGQVLPIVGERARVLVAPDGSSVPLANGPPPPPPGDPYDLLPESWVG